MGDTTTVKSQTQVLVVEDDAEIRDLMSLLLLRQGYSVQMCRSVFEAEEFLQKVPYNLLVLDWMLPGASGIDLLKKLRSVQSQVPVLMVTAKGEPEDIVQGLEAGADDYITKPFEPNIFTVRVKALLRRSMHQLAPLESDLMVLGEIEMNVSSHQVKFAGIETHLTPSEFKILATLIQQRGKVMTRESLIEIVQGEGISVTGRTIDTHVFGLRKKMGTCADWIETIRGIGYRVRAD